MASHLVGVLLHHLSRHKALSSQVDRLLAGEPVEEAVGGEDYKLVASRVDGEHADFRLAQHEVAQLLLLRVIVLNCDLLALEIPKRPRHCQTTKYAAEDNVAALACDAVLLVFSTGFEVLTQLDKAAFATEHGPRIAQVGAH